MKVAHASGLRFPAATSGPLVLPWAFALLLAASPPPDGFAEANSPGSTSDFAIRIQSIEQRTGGRIGGATNDVAIIRPPGRAPILVAIYSIGSTSASADDRAATVAEAARAVAEFLSK